MTMEPAATRARTQGDKGEPFRPQRNAIFERPRHMHSASAAAARVHACVTPPLFRAAPRMFCHADQEFAFFRLLKVLNGLCNPWRIAVGRRAKYL